MCDVFSLENMNEYKVHVLKLLESKCVILKS